MIFFPKAKINIGLNIIRKRTDGYHELESLFYPIPLFDSLEWIKSKESGMKVFSKENGIINRCMELEKNDNLVIKAYKLLQKDYSLPCLTFYLIKNIPTGAGLGGGSSDAAYTLRGLNEAYSLGLNTEQLRNYASQLGSDCAFFIEALPSLATGRGEILKPFPLKLENYFLVLIKPSFSIPTAEAYSGISPKEPRLSLENSLIMPIQDWKTEIKNDFEETLFIQFPQLQNLKNELYRQGALYASLSGSGSAIYGIFKKPIKIPVLEKENQVFYLSL